MSDYSVELNRMSQESGEIASLTSQMKSIESELNSIASGLPLEGSTGASIKKSIRQLSSQTGDVRNKVNSYSKILSDIVDEYRRTENKVANLSGEKVNPIVGKIASIASKIGGIGKIAGIGKVNAQVFSKDPVNLNTGNFIYEKSIFKIDSPVDFNFGMFYNCMGNTGGGLGKGWVHTFESKISIEDDIYYITKEDGSESKFANYEGRYYPIDHQDEKLVKTKNGYQLTDHTESVWTFDISGRLLRCDYQNKESIIYAYVNNILTKVGDSVGNTYEFKWNEEGRIASVQDMTGRVVCFSYENGMLIAVTDAAGRTTKYAYDERGRLIEVINPRGQLAVRNSYDGENRCVGQEFADGGKIQYIYEDNKTTMVEANGNRITYERDDLGRNIRIIHENGEELFEYDDNNNYKSVTDRKGNTSYYDHDARGNVTSFINAVGDEVKLEYNEKNQVKSVYLNDEFDSAREYDDNFNLVYEKNAIGAEVRYDYDEKGCLKTFYTEDGLKIDVSAENGYITGVTNSQGGKTTYEYDTLHRVSKTVDPLGNVTRYSYNEADELIEVIDATGAKQTYKYDLSGNLIETVDFKGGVTSSEFSAQNKPIKITNALGNSTMFEYDKMWNPIRRTEANGAINTFEYDQYQNLIAFTDPNGGVNRMEYDENGNLIKRTGATGAVYEIAYDAMNRSNQITLPDGSIVSCTYDARGNVTSVVHGDGSEDVYQYDAVGNMIYEKERCGIEHFLKYDKANRIIEEADSDGWQERHEYYQGGLVKKIESRTGECNEFFYDKNENLIRVDAAGADSLTLEYDSLNRVSKVLRNGECYESYLYDALGNVISVTNAVGDTTNYEYDLVGELVAVTDPLGNRTSYTYDNVGNMTEVIQYLNDEVDGITDADDLLKQSKKLITSIKYDLMGHALEVINPAGYSEKYTYDANGRMTSKTDADGRQMFIEYNLDGTEKAYKFSDGRKVEMQYDALRQLIEYEDWIGKTTIVRNENGYPINVKDSNGNEVGYTWGKNGERLSVIYPDGEEISYEYNEAKQLISTSYKDEKVAYAYDEFGRLIEKKNSNGLAASYGFNKLGRQDSIKYTQDGSLIFSQMYEYDAEDRKIGIRASSDEGEKYTSYKYDKRGQLAEVYIDGELSESYTYDIRGNRVSGVVNGSKTTYRYNRLNQLISLSNGDVTEYEYDKAGHLIKEKSDYETKTYEFDALGFISKAKSNVGEVTYAYDGFGRRVSKEVTFTSGKIKNTAYTLDFVKDSNNILVETVDGEKCSYWWDDTLVGAIKPDGNTSFYATDDKMSVLFMIEGNGNVRVGNYETFGKNNALRGETSSFGYAGYMPDETTGLYHVNRREYNPTIGRFISPDMIRGAITIPLTLNVYLYCMCDPVNMVDPSGAWGALIAGVVGLVSRVAAQAAADIVTSVVAGKPKFSSWQDYVGQATGGFVEGSTYVLAGGPMNPSAKVISGAAGEATATLTSNGLKMATGVEGYRKEDGYTWMNLLKDTSVSAIAGGTTGYVFGSGKIKALGKEYKVKAFTNGSRYYRTVMTKVAKGMNNARWKTLKNGLIGLAASGAINAFTSKAEKEGKKWLMNKGIDLVKNAWDSVTQKKMPGKENVVNATTYLSANRIFGTCAA